MLTTKDIDHIETIVREIVKEEIRFLPPKDELYEKLDEVTLSTAR